MDNMDFYEVIFKRKSIRKYKNEPLADSLLERVNTCIGNLSPLYDDIKTEIVVLSGDDIKLLLPIRSPHYITIYSENKEGWLVNAGYMLQQLDLFLSANGIGACWLGMGMPKKGVALRNGLEFVITMAMGYPDEALHRDSTAEFKRKATAEISEVKNDLGDSKQADELIEAARLAPSASNTQPWYFSGTGDSIIISRKLPNLLKAALYGKFNQIDMGIVMCHLKVAAVHLGKTMEFKREAAEVPKGHEYIATAKLQVPGTKVDI